MNVLRRAPLSRLLIVCAAILVLGVAATAFAGTLGAGTPPPPKPLAGAVHDALAAAPVEGLSARVRLTNHLIDTAGLQTQGGEGSQGASSPLLSGASGRVWISRTGKVRLELQSDSGDTQVLYDGQTISFYDSASSTLYRLKLPPDSGHATEAAHARKIPTVEEIQHTITRIMGHATLSGATPGVVAGQPAYTVRISPSRDGGLVGGAELAWDAVHGVPLRLALYASSSTTPVLELTATDISYGSVPDSTFDFSTAPGVTVHDIQAPTGKHADHADHAVGKQVDVAFPATPATLAGMPRGETRSIEVDGHPATLSTYGRGLAGIAVIQSAAKTAAQQPSAPSSSAAPLPLPTVSIGAGKATELPTALGTLLHFERAGVSYTLLGSVTPAVAEAAARGL